MISTLLEPTDEYLHISFDEAMSLYKGFGREIFDTMKLEMPEVFAQLTFFRNLKWQLNDCYAEYNSKSISFVIQLDPDIELIVLWNKTIQTEIGTWSANPVEEAIDFIRLEFLSLK